MSLLITINISGLLCASERYPITENGHKWKILLINLYSISSAVYFFENLLKLIRYFPLRLMILANCFF